MADRKAVILAVGRIGGAEAGSTLMRIYGRITSYRGRPGAQVGDDELIALLRTVIQAYTYCNDKSVVGSIAGRYGAYRGALNVDVIRALAVCGHLDPDAATERLRTALADPDPRVSALAAGALDNVLGRAGN